MCKLEHNLLGNSAVSVHILSRYTEYINLYILLPSNSYKLLSHVHRSTCSSMIVDLKSENLKQTIHQYRNSECNTKNFFKK